MPVTMYSAKDTIMDMTYKDPVPCRNCLAHSECSINVNFILFFKLNSVFGGYIQRDY